MSSKNLKVKKFRDKRTWKEQEEYKKKSKSKIGKKDKLYVRNCQRESTND
jgi:hypothetical protein